MTKESLVFIIGLLVLMVPKLGIPTEWKEYFLIGTGVLLMLIGYILRRTAYIRSIENEKGERTTDSYVESTPETDTNHYRDLAEV